MLEQLTKTLLIFLVLATVAVAQTQLSIQTSEPAWISVDQQRRGFTTAATPQLVPVPVGKHTISAEALIGGSRQELEVEASANATTYVSIKLGLLPVSHPVPTSPVFNSGQDPLRQQQKELERQQRESQIKQIEEEITSLEQQMVQAQGVKDQADQARQDCQAQNVPGFLGALKASNCLLGTLNANKAQQQVRQLQVQITAKQREIQRLERQSSAF